MALSKRPFCRARSAVGDCVQRVCHAPARTVHAVGRAWCYAMRRTELAYAAMQCPLLSSRLVQYPVLSLRLRERMALFDDVLYLVSECCSRCAMAGAEITCNGTIRRTEQPHPLHTNQRLFPRLFPQIKCKTAQSQYILYQECVLLCLISRSRLRSYSSGLWSYAIATHCPARVLTWAPLLSGCYRMGSRLSDRPIRYGTGTAYPAMRLRMIDTMA
eukprot:3940877-Rhodomonas_salina.6